MSESSRRQLEALGVFDWMGAVFLGEGRHVRGGFQTFSVMSPRIREVLRTVEQGGNGQLSEGEEARKIIS